MKLSWITISAIHHRRQVLRGIILVDVWPFERALEQATAAALIHVEDLVMGYEVETDDLPAVEARAIAQLPRLELLDKAKLVAAGLEFQA